MNTQEYKFGTWYPIEKAPKDGTRVILWDGFDQTVARFTESDVFARKKEWCYGECSDDYNTLPTVDCPTHWMPCPLSPEEQAEQSRPTSDDGVGIILSEIRLWIEFAEQCGKGDDDAIMSPPTWPTVGVLREWERRLVNAMPMSGDLLSASLEELKRSVARLSDAIERGLK